MTTVQVQFSQNGTGKPQPRHQMLGVIIETVDPNNQEKP